MALSGYLYDGRCIATFDSLVTAFKSQFPLIHNGTIMTLNYANGFPAVDGASMTLTTSMYGYQLSSNVVISSATKLVTFSRCDPAIPFDGLTPFSAVTAASYWMYAMTLVLGVYLLALNAGAILRFIQGRRW